MIDRLSWKSNFSVQQHINLVFNLFYLLYVTMSANASCPKVCDCKWKDGKEVVMCINQNLTSIPNNLDPGILVLNFVGNYVTTLDKDMFESAGLLNLQKLYLSRCRVRYVDRHAFRSLRNLMELDLSHNALASIPTTAFAPIPDLRELKLNGNPIMRIQAYAFTFVHQLIRIEMAKCRIGLVDEKAFVGLENTLEWLNLDDNRLIDLNEKAFKTLKSLHGIDLNGNPLNCSCKMLPLKDWLAKYSVGQSPTCRYPDFNRNRNLAKLTTDDFACLPSAVITEKIINAYEGENVTLRCTISGIPLPEVRWSLRDLNLPNATDGKWYIQSSNKHCNLTIVSLEVQDTGLYVCTAQNKAGKSLADVTLIIEKTPIGTILSEKVVLVGILLTAVLIIFICSIILFIRVIYCKQDTQADMESKRRIITEKIEMKRNSAFKRSSSIATDLKTDSAEKKIEVKVEPTMEQDENGEKRPSRPKDLKTTQSNYKSERETPSPSMFECHIGEMALQHHVLHKKALPSGELYTTAMAFMTDDTMDYDNDVEQSTSVPSKKIPYSETIPNLEPTNNRSRKPYSSYPRVSESQSPLLRDKNYDSSTESVYNNYSNRHGKCQYQSLDDPTRHPSPIVGRKQREAYPTNPNIPSSPVREYRRGRYYGNEADPNSVKESNRSYSNSDRFQEPRSRIYHNTSSKYNSLPFRKDSDRYYNNAERHCTKETPLLNDIDSHVNYSTYSEANDVTDSITYDYHATQLERFLDEYRRLQQELSKMKESCDRISSQSDITERKYGSLLEQRQRSLDVYRPEYDRFRPDYVDRPLQAKSCSFERSVSFVPTLRDTAVKCTQSDDVVIPKSILKKKNEREYDYRYRKEFSSSTLPSGRRRRLRRYSDSSAEGYYD